MPLVTFHPNGAKKIIGNEGEKFAIEQKELLGTGQALKEALPTFQNINANYILVVNGDVPLISPTLIKEITKKAQEEKSDVLLVTIELDDIGAYGRIVRNKENSIQAIVEAKDYNEKVHGKATKEVNAGLYIFAREFAENFLPKLTNNNANKEYYITDLIGLAIENKLKVIAHNAGNDETLLGINNPLELSFAEEFLRKKRNEEFMKNGVILHNPASITIGKNVEISAGVEIFPYCELYGNTKISFACTLESHCIIKNSTIKERTYVKSYSHLEDSYVDENCTLGPFARLRPQARLEKEVHIGNFVEIKKSTVHTKAKVNHLTYIGDSEIGPKTNIGAGTITCNYDGVNKHKTIIGENCFIGSNTALVAPVTIGNNVLIGAGSVVTKDANENELVVARAEQVNIKKKK